MTSITWAGESGSGAWTSPGCVRLLDQRLLPGREQFLELSDPDVLVDAIRGLAVRGAPALGIAGALGVALAVQRAQQAGWPDRRRDDAISRVRAARPTAVNLARGVDRAAAVVNDGLDAVLALAHQLARADEADNRTMSAIAVDWLAHHLPKQQDWQAITHCNTGALATGAWGTAFGVLHQAHLDGRLGLVYADETRPLLQGSRLTAWELDRAEIPYRVLPDSAAAGLILSGAVDFAVVGADRIAANGDTANKVGTLAVALAAHEAQIPFLVIAPDSTIDLTCPDGTAIEIEFRDEAEVLEVDGHRVAPSASRAWNPAFDVTPYRYISAVITQSGQYRPPQDRPAAS